MFKVLCCTLANYVTITCKTANLSFSFRIFLEGTPHNYVQLLLLYMETSTLYRYHWVRTGGSLSSLIQFVGTIMVV